jgi:hypothetical protein
MICDNCKVDRIESDFINNQKFCYRCEYRKRLEIKPKNRTVRPKTCRLCGSIIQNIDGLKKRQRTIYCSVECSEKGYQEMRKNHWTRKVQIPITK